MTKGKGKKMRQKASSSSSMMMMVKKKKKILNFDVPLTELNTTEKMDLIAELSEAVLQDPQSSFQSSKNEYTTNSSKDDGDGEDGNYLQGHSKMKRLLELALMDKNGQDEGVARLATVSLLAIYQDILPSDRIRLPTAAETSVRVSKETKQQWNYERSLLTNYQQYLKHLHSTWESSSSSRNSKKMNHNQSPSAFSMTAILCMCELLKSVPHMNFRSNILSVIVRQMNHKQCTEVSTACCQTIQHLFQQDGQGEIALEASKCIAKLIRTAPNTINPQVIRTFLSIPLRVHADEAEAAKLAAATHKKKKRKQHDNTDGDVADDAIERDLKDGNAGVDKIVLARCQSETLHTITLTYFRIVKEKTNQVSLLAPALEGLAKFSHLINIDTVMDMLHVLKQLLQDRADTLTLEASLQCILTAFQTLQGPGRELQVDEKEYIAPLYPLLPRYTHMTHIYIHLFYNVYDFLFLILLLILFVLFFFKINY